MITREPTLERLAIAQQLMLEPFGITEATLQQALSVIREHRVDDADLYFQTTRHEGWSLEEGIVKSGSFSIDQGVASGQLNARETQRLEREQKHIATAETKAEADGKVTNKERAHLSHMQNKASRDIHREKHDAQTAGK